MTDRPIIFSAPMVRALLAGTKTQTRRLAWRESVAKMRDGGDMVCRAPSPWQDAKPGDRLWVRENFIGATGYDELLPSKFGNKPIWYAADGEPDRAKWWHLSDRTRPSIHMPRWASRLTLTVTEVRVQRLQEISEADSATEGLIQLPASRRWVVNRGEQYAGLARHTAKGRFADLWNSIQGPDAWDRNPEVVALTFTVARANIDA